MKIRSGFVSNSSSSSFVMLGINLNKYNITPEIIAQKILNKNNDTRELNVDIDDYEVFERFEEDTTYVIMTPDDGESYIFGKIIGGGGDLVLLDNKDYTFTYINSEVNNIKSILSTLDITNVDVQLIMGTKYG